MTKQTIKYLINKNNKYKAQSWCNKNEPLKNFWTKFTSAYSNLNHVMASEIVNTIKETQDNLKFDDANYAKEFAQLLVDKKFSIAALVGVMRQGKLSFSGTHFYKFLDVSHKGYVKEPGLFTEQIMVRMEALKALPYEGVDLTKEEKDYIQDSKTPLELVDILIQKPTNKSFTEYPAFIESAVKDEDGNLIDTARKTEVILLGLKNLMNYENLYTDKVEVKKVAELVNDYQPVNNSKIDAKTEEECLTKIEIFIVGKESNPDKKILFANQLFKSLNAVNLIGTGYEKSVVDYVVAESAQNRDKATRYAIYEARKAVKVEIQQAANSLRKALLGTENINLINTEKIEFQKDTKNITIKKFLEKAATSGRLQREVKKYVTQQLKAKNKLNDAVMTVSSDENVQKMAAMLGSMDQETFTLIGAIMSNTMAEIEAEHNLNPEFWHGTMSRGWNKFTSYPAAAFFAVVDFFTIVFEYICEYATRGAYKAYEGVRDLVGKTVSEKRENQEIFKQTDVKTAMDALVKSLQDADKNIDTTQVKSTAKDELRDAILKFFKDGNNNENNNDLKTKLNAVDDSLAERSELKTAIDKIKDQADFSQHKKSLQAILDMPEMNQNISNALPNWANNAKAVAVLKSIG